MTDRILIRTTGQTGPGIAEHLADTSDAHDASAISVLDTAGNYTATNVETVLAELPSRHAPLTAAPGVIVPSSAATLATSSASTWFAADFSTGVRFDVDRRKAVSRAIVPCTVASGNIEISIHKLIETENVGEYVTVRVATTGVIACPSPSSSRILPSFTSTVTLDPGHYALMLWCDNTTAQFHHNVSTTQTASQLCVAFSGASATATPASGLAYRGGRAFLGLIEEVGVSLGDVVSLGDSLSTATYQWLRVAMMLSGQTYGLTFAGNAGEKSATIAARVATDVVASTPDICIVLAGSNDIGSTETAAEIKANLTTIYNACNTAGIDVVACTIPPRDDASLGSALADARYVILDDVNTWIRARTDVVAICDWTVQLSTGDGRRPSSTYFTDQVHPNAAGVKLMGEIMATTLAALPA